MRFPLLTLERCNLWQMHVDGEKLGLGFCKGNGEIELQRGKEVSLGQIRSEQLEALNGGTYVKRNTQKHLLFEGFDLI